MKNTISLICAMARNHAIGIQNDLPWHLPPDLLHFKTLTQNKPIIMGRLTYQSILARRDGKPLPHRPHYVVTRSDLSPLPTGVSCFSTLNDAIAAAQADHPDSEIMIIGGASIYEQAVSIVDRMYLTIIDTDIEGDAFFPRYSSGDWVVSEEQSAQYEALPYRFLTLDRK